MKEFKERQIYQIHYTVRKDQKEYLERLARKYSMSLASMLKENYFNNGWREDLEKLRKEQRKMGIRDSEFLKKAK